MYGKNILFYEVGWQIQMLLRFANHSRIAVCVGIFETRQISKLEFAVGENNILGGIWLHQVSHRQGGQKPSALLAFFPSWRGEANEVPRGDF